MFNILEMKDIEQIEKTIMVHEVLGVPTTVDINAVIDYVFSERFKSGNGGSNKTYDFIKDYQMTYVSFLMAYPSKIKTVEDMNSLVWAEFRWMLDGVLMRDDMPISQVVKIRSEKLPKRTNGNAGYVDWLVSAKAKWALEKERENIGLGGMFAILKQMAKE
jgi:hypothetical protein